jgi:hypothetical protein
MLVSTERPFSMAAMLAPLPKWQVMMRRCRMSSRSASAARWATYWWLGPWKP